MLVLIPPIVEQEQICKHLDTATAEFNALITNTERQIALLREFRTLLIADVVTGKLDVRKAAHRLPVEVGSIKSDMEEIDTIEEEFQEPETMGEAYG